MATSQLQHRVRLKVYPVPGRSLALARLSACTEMCGEGLVVGLERSRFRKPRMRWGSAKGDFSL